MSVVPIKEIIKRADRACKMAAKEVGEEIQLAYDESVTDFYSSYSPTWYDRTGSTYKASTGYSGKTSWQIGEMHYRCGIRLDPGLMGEPYNIGNHGWAKYGIATADFIFSRTWDLGIHGFTAQEFQATNDLMRSMGFKEWDLGIINPKTHKKFESWQGLWAYRRSIGKPLPTKMTGSSSYRSPLPPVARMNQRMQSIWGDIDGKIDKYFSL